MRTAAFAYKRYVARGSLVRMICSPLLGASMLWLGACHDPCENEQLLRVTSPDGKREAVVFRRGCGATTAPSTQVSSVAAGAKAPTGVGNVIVTEDAANVTPRWISPTDLLLTMDPATRVITRNATVDGVSVEYQSTR